MNIIPIAGKYIHVTLIFDILACIQVNLIFDMLIIFQLVQLLSKLIHLHKRHKVASHSKGTITELNVDGSYQSLDGCTIWEHGFKTILLYGISTVLVVTPVFHLNVFLQYAKHQFFMYCLQEYRWFEYTLFTCKWSFLAILGEAGSSICGSMFRLTPWGNI